MAETSVHSYYFWIGIGLSLIASLCSATGLAFQRLSHQRNNAKPIEEQLPATRQWLNLLGISLLFVECLFDLTAMGFAPAALLSCMSAMTLVFNMILAPALCGEVVSRKDITINAIVICGTIISVWFGPHTTPSYDLQELQGFWATNGFITYAICGLIWIGVLVFIHTSLRKENATLFVNMDKTTRSQVLRFTYPVLAGSIGGNTAIYAKASVELIKTTIRGENQFIYLGTYVMLALVLLCVTGQLYFLNSGLARYESLFVVPVYQVMWMSSTILGALFFFQEIRHLSASHILCFVLGVAISVFGILLHSTRASPADKEVDSMTNASDYVPAAEVTPVKGAMQVMEEYGTEHCGSPLAVCGAQDDTNSEGSGSRKVPLLV